ncbi:auxin response factor 18-like isoform X1 [Iris pallida]|uniref:Auxin response factor n=1 Tax=Iris pallida TaxID=29817 RepID=A0AAX6ERN9_IRIPA|nr:auxin response factor 18-like isoform X1 [Iris pallida]
MIMCGDPKKELFKGSEKCLDPQLWHACAGGMVRMPPANSKVYYFPQGHAEYSETNVEFASGLTRIPAFVLCHVASVKFLADKEMDEVFAKIRLVPVRADEADFHDVDDELALTGDGSDVPEKPASFAKTLTQSDANNGGGFSVPRYCAETIFPPLDYSADPPVQTIVAKDVHGEMWKFRHIYRGTPRRHLLTTGWSTFVNLKKLVAGDSIMFLRLENGELCIGIRRTKRGIGVGANSISGWNPPPNGSYGSPYGGFSMSLREEESKLMRSNGNGRTNAGGFANTRGRGRVKAESVVEAAKFAATGQPFEVVYYPRASIPEFCVKAASVRAAMRIQWCSGMRFKMSFETEDSSRISWFMGTVSSVQAADPLRWPNSPWRLLQVRWDEPDLLQNVDGVSPWLVELVSSIPSVHLSPFSPPRKKLRIPQHPDVPLDFHLPTPVFVSGKHPLGPSSNSAGIQGARHLQFGNISLPNLQINKLQSRLFQTDFHHLDRPNPISTVSTDLFITNPIAQNNVSCLLTIGSPGESLKKPSDGKTPLFVLFGQPILTEEQISVSNSGNSSSDGNHEKITSPSDGFLSSVHPPTCEGLPWFRDYKAADLELETGHCKVFMESEDVGRTLDLSVLSSYEELYDRLAAMFGVEKSEMMGHVLYRNGFGEIKHTGDEPFSDFTKTARRLTVLLDSGSDSIGR